MESVNYDDPIWNLPALSVRQPWAWLIVQGFKDVENRNWPTKFRGPVLIHASNGLTFPEYEGCLSTCHLVSVHRPFPEGTIMPSFKGIERGGIVGITEIVDCVEDMCSPWFFGDYGFVLKNSRALPFRPCKGALGFFKPDYASRYVEKTKKQKSAALPADDLFGGVSE